MTEQGISGFWNFECLTKNKEYNRLKARVKYANRFLGK